VLLYKDLPLPRKIRDDEIHIRRDTTITLYPRSVTDTRYWKTQNFLFIYLFIYFSLLFSSHLIIYSPASFAMIINREKERERNENKNIE
jgi:hypothetical protein